MEITQYHGAIHFHSKHSYDSITSVPSIAQKALKKGWNFVVLTDHDTIAGSLELREYVKKHNLPLEVPIAAEYKTSIGDVIAVFIEREIKACQIEDFIAEVRSQGGLLLLPHPYVSHKNVEQWAPHMDLIEIFNSRQSIRADEKSKKLCEDLKKTAYYSPDAHLLRNLDYAPLKLKKAGSLKDSFLSSTFEPERLKKSTRIEVRISQLISFVKK